MSQISEDIRAAAETISGRFSKRGHYNAALASDISVALMAERERCALIAENCDSFPFEGDHIGKLIRSPDAGTK